MTDYLLSAKTVLDHDAPSPYDLALADTHTLISIAESLARIADGLRANYTDGIPAARGSDLSDFQAESVPVPTPEDSKAAEGRLVEEVARAIHATYMIVNPEVSPSWVELPDDGDEYRDEARAALAAIRERYVIEPKARP